MKKELYFLIIIVLCNINCTSKPKETGEKPTIKNETIIKNISVAKQTIVDSIEVDTLSVKRNGNLDVKFYDSSQDIINAFGQPDSVYNYYFEINEQNAVVYAYNGSKFYFLNDQLDSYEILSSDFHVGNSNSYFSVGENITSLLPLFPNYATNKNQNRIYANLSKNGSLVDYFIYIQYDPSTENITNISIRSY